MSYFDGGVATNFGEGLLLGDGLGGGGGPFVSVDGEGFGAGDSR
jgi:hypothetical protein